MEIFSKRQEIYRTWRETRIHLCHHFWIALSDTVADLNPLDWSVKYTDSGINSNRKDHVNLFVLYLYKDNAE